MQTRPTSESPDRLSADQLADFFKTEGAPEEPTEQPVADEEEEEPEAPSDEPAETEDDGDEGEDATEDSSDDSDEGDDFKLPETLEELAEATGLTVEEILGRKLKYKAAGSEKEATLQEIITKAQLGEGADARFAEAKQLRSQYGELTRQTTERFQQGHAALENTLRGMVEWFDQQANADWMRDLRREDPGEYTARMQEIEGLKGHFVNLYQTAAKDFGARLGQQTQEWQQHQMQSLKQLYPDWGEEHASKALESLEEFEVSPDEAAHLDYRLINASVKYADMKRENEELKARLEQSNTRKARQLKRLREQGPRQKAQRTEAQQGSTKKMQLGKRFADAPTRDNLAALFAADEE